MQVWGLTGGISTGKSTVAGLLREAGVPVIDADRVARDVVEPGEPALAAIAARFGEGVLDDEGRLDRPALRAIVLADPEARRALEGITHPAIHARIGEELAALAETGTKLAFVEAALMVETGSYRLYQGVLVVSCDPGVQLQRLMARNQIGRDEALRWTASQLPLADKEAVADELVINDGDRSALRAAVHAALERIRQ